MGVINLNYPNGLSWCPHEAQTNLDWYVLSWRLLSSIILTEQQCGIRQWYVRISITYHFQTLISYVHVIDYITSHEKFNSSSVTTLCSSSLLYEGDLYSPLTTKDIDCYQYIIHKYSHFNTKRRSKSAPTGCWTI